MLITPESCINTYITMQRRKVIPILLSSLFTPVLAQNHETPDIDDVMEFANQFGAAYNEWGKIVETVPEGAISINENRAWNRMTKAFDELKKEHNKYLKVI